MFTHPSAPRRRIRAWLRRLATPAREQILIIDGERVAATWGLRLERVLADLESGAPREAEAPDVAACEVGAGEGGAS